MHNEYTSERIASIAARGLDDPASLTPAEIKAVCGSALTQIRPVLASLPTPPVARGSLGHFDALFCGPRRRVDASKTIAAGHSPGRRVLAG